MDEVAYIIRRIAHDADVSIDLIHHNVKENSGDSEKRAGDQNAARGAAIIGAARSTYTLSRMSKTTAKEYGIPPEQAGVICASTGRRRITQHMLGRPYGSECGASIFGTTPAI